MGEEVGEELYEHRLKRLHMRSMRRGIKEMDLILSAFAADHLAQLDAADLDDYDALLNENDQDLYRWVTGQEAAPDRFSALISRISKTFQRESSDLGGA
jgi:antitoxin CptB